MQLTQTYDPPGDLRNDGPRHDNDFADIADIRVVPTHEELLSPVAPYLPVSTSDAPHHLPAHSMERHLDIQFRLLREELMCVHSPFRVLHTLTFCSSSTRSSIVAINYDILAINERRNGRREKTKLEQVLAKGGGAYKTTGFDSVFFQVYANATFCPVKAERRSLTVGLSLAAPSGPPQDKDAKKRYAYWEHSKRLQSGSLVALVIVEHGTMKTFFGVISSFGKDIAESLRLRKRKWKFRPPFSIPRWSSWRSGDTR